MSQASVVDRALLMKEVGEDESLREPTDPRWDAVQRWTVRTNTPALARDGCGAEVGLVEWLPSTGCGR